MTNNGEQGKGTGFPGLVSAGKDLVALIRDATIFFLALLLIIFPKTFNSRLVQAGFEKGNVMGLEWKSGLVSSNAALEEAHKSISDLQDKSAELVKTLVGMGNTVTDHALKEKISQIEQDASQLKVETQNTKARVSQTIASNKQLVTSAASEPRATRGRDYLVGLQTLGLPSEAREALNEKIRGAGYGLHNLSGSYDIDKRPSWFSPRSTVLYYADSALPAAETLAGLLKDLTGQQFRVQRGAGLGVDPSERDITLFVHYIKK